VGIIAGFANDGIAGVPGVLRVTVEDENRRVLKAVVWMPAIRCPARFDSTVCAAPGNKMAGAEMRAEIEVRGMRYPVRWACRQKLNEDGSLILRPNLRRQV